MTPDEIRKLLGGYATGTLTDDERNLLFSAALEDQQLFEALADEEALRELLTEPEARQALLEELQQAPVLLGTSSPADLRVPMQSAASPAPAAYRAAPVALRDPESWLSRLWALVTPPRLAMAGGIAAIVLIVLIVGGIRYRGSRAPVEMAANLAKTADPQRDQRQLARSNAPAQESNKESGAVKSIPSPRAARPQVSPPVSGIAVESERRVAGRSLEAGSRDIAKGQAGMGGGLAAGRSEPSPGTSASGSAADARERADTASSLKDAEEKKETASASAAREELNQAVRQKAAEARSSQETANTVNVEASAPAVAAVPSSPAGNSGQFAQTSQSKARAANADANAPGADARRNERDAPRPAAASAPIAASPGAAPIGPSQIVLGGLRPAAAPPPPSPVGAVRAADATRELNAKVTDVNGTIVSINAGTNAGLKNGDAIEIIRDNRVIATSKLSQVGATFAVGPLQRVAGVTEMARAGDAVRRGPAQAAPGQPQR